MQKRRSERWKNRQKHSALFLLIYLIICVLVFFLVWKITGYTSGMNTDRRYQAELLSAAEVAETEEDRGDMDTESPKDEASDASDWW